MKNRNNIVKYTLIMTAVNLIMRSAGVSFNAYLTSKIGSAGIGLFQLVMSVYSLAVTFSTAGIRLATMRITVEIGSSNKNDLNKTLAMCITYGGFCGSVIGFLLLIFADIISVSWIGNAQTAFPLRVLAASLPFVGMSSALGGYFTASGKIPQYSVVQMLEQGAKIAIVIFLVNKTAHLGAFYSASSIVAGMTASEIISFSLSMLLKKLSLPPKSNRPASNIIRVLRVALPDAAGACARNILLTIEHLLIPKGFEKSGAGAADALAAYGSIHAMAMPLLLYPSAIISSLSSLLIPDLAMRREIGDNDGINISVARNLKRTLIFSLACAGFFFGFAPMLSDLVYKSKEAVMYIRILSPLVPIMYLDMITDGMLKGLDQQIYSMRYNIIDSLLCVILVYFLLPKYAVKGYIFILYASEIINFFLSFNRLISVCDIKIKGFRAPLKDSSTFSRLKKRSVFPAECGYRKYRDQRKRSQAL